MQLTNFSKVLLIGIGGTYNYGCEAIVRGTVNILRKYNPSLEIYYASYNYNDDLKRLKGCDINIINRERRGKIWLLRKIIKKLSIKLGYDFVIPYDSFSWILNDRIDTIFSIGGDIYTLPPGIFFKKSLSFFCDKCIDNGLKYILWGASIGPFDKNPKALEYYKKHLKKANLIVAREENTINYLKEIGIVNNVKLAPDPAFFVTVNSDNTINEKKSQKNIGINLSPLSATYEYGSIDKGIQKQLQVLTHILDITDYNIILLPHVISPKIGDNDLWYMKQIYELLPLSVKNRVELIESDPGFIGLKMIIKNCSYVIAARMHCAINAISCDVPVIFLAYSEKAKGMAKFVYNTSDLVFPLSEFQYPDRFFSLVNNWNYKSNLNEIRKFNFNNLLEDC